MNIAGTALGASTYRTTWAQGDVGGLLTDPPSFPVGHATLEESITGRTVIVCPESRVGGVAAEVVAAATRAAVRQATSRADVPDKHSSGARSPDERVWSAGETA